MALPQTSYTMLRSSILGRMSELKGGAGSGNFGHTGRPGERGGSSSEGGDTGGKADIEGKVSHKNNLFTGEQERGAVIAGISKRMSEERINSDDVSKIRITSLSGLPSGFRYSGNDTDESVRFLLQKTATVRITMKDGSDKTLYHIPLTYNRKSLPPEYLKSEHQYSSTQVNISDCSPDGSKVTNRIRALARLIPDDVLAEDGREDTPHVTVKYGLETDDPKDVRNLLGEEHTISLSIGPVDCFYANETGTAHDVIILRVYSPDLVRLNRLLTDEVENETTFSYNPHITLAYVLPGMGKDFVEVVNAANLVSGTTLFTDTIIFSNRERKQTHISLGGTVAMSQRLRYDTLAGNIRERLAELSSDYKGGAGSGNFGHGGRPGERGGSSSEGGGEGRTDAASRRDYHNRRASEHTAKMRDRSLDGTSHTRHMDAADAHNAAADRYDEAHHLGNLPDAARIKLQADNLAKDAERLSNRANKYDAGKASSTPDAGWQKEDGGYTATFGGKTAKLEKSGGKWKLSFNGKQHELPKKANFNHAEGIIRKVLKG